MKFAIVTDDEKTVSRHFGQARYYLVFSAVEGGFVTSERRDKSSHHHSASPADHRHEHKHADDPAAHERHVTMAAAIQDCEALISGGMGRGAYQSLERLGIRPIVTDLTEIESIVNAYIAGTLKNHTEKLH